MPKRKHDSDLDYLCAQIKKLKRKLKRVRKHDETSSSSETEENTRQLEHSVEETEIIDDVPNEQTLPELSDTVETPNNVEAPSNIASNNLDTDILEILGDDPSCSAQYGKEIHKELASRLQHIALSGLTKEARKELQQKYLLPSNGVLLGAPTMNPEIKAALTEVLANRDTAIETKQKLLASAITCIASATTQLLECQDKNKELLLTLMDANKILCDIQHSDSNTRRMFSMSILKKDVKTQILNSKIDKFLFGENLPDTLKSAKAVSKSSAEIKSVANKNVNPQPSTSKQSNLNSKRPAAPNRKPPAAPQKARQPAYQQGQPGKSYRTSSQPQRTTNYRR